MQAQTNTHPAAGLHEAVVGCAGLPSVRPAKNKFVLRFYDSCRQCVFKGRSILVFSNEQLRRKKVALQEQRAKHR